MQENVGGGNEFCKVVAEVSEQGEIYTLKDFSSSFYKHMFTSVDISSPTSKKAE